MKSAAKYLAIAVIGVAFLGGSNSFAQEKSVDWKKVSKNLVRSLSSGNEGVRQSAMDFYIQNADKLDIDAAVYDVMHVYRNHKDERVKKLALVTLYKMQNKWAMEFLKVDLRFQDSEELKHMVAAIVQEYEAKKNPS